MNHRRHFYAFWSGLVLMMVSLAWTYAGQAVFPKGGKYWSGVIFCSVGAAILLLMLPVAIRDISRASREGKPQKTELPPLDFPGKRRLHVWSSVFSPLGYLPLVTYSLCQSLTESGPGWQFKAISIVIFLVWVFAAGLYIFEGWRGYKESRLKESAA